MTATLGASQSVAAARLGFEVLMLSCVGNDIFAENTLNNFKRNEIDTAYVLLIGATSGVAPIFVDRDSNNLFLIIKGAGDAFIGCFCRDFVAIGDVEKSLSIAARYAAWLAKLGIQTSYATREEFEGLQFSRLCS